MNHVNTYLKSTINLKKEKNRLNYPLKDVHVILVMVTLCTFQKGYIF